MPFVENMCSASKSICFQGACLANMILRISLIVSLFGIFNGIIARKEDPIRSPIRDGFYYIVKENERLANILQRYKIPFDEFIAENEHVNVDFLEVGEELFLPVAKRLQRAEKWLIPISGNIVSRGHGWQNWPRRFFHNGIDFMGSYRPVHAARSGIVSYSGWLDGFGSTVIIKHEDGYKTLYSHLIRRHVAVGQKILQGQPIGRSGDGCMVHLHFEISMNGKSLNPFKFFKKGLKYPKYTS